METVIQILISGIMLGGVYALGAMGLNLIFGVANIINFAHGEFLMLGMYVAFWIWALTGIDPYIAAPLIFAVSFALGVVFYLGLMKHTIYKPELTQVFTTLGVGIFIQNAALMAWSADYRTVQVLPQGAESVLIGDFYISTTRLISFCFAIVILGAVIWFIRRTHTGQAIEAVSQDLPAAELMGINVSRIFLITFGLGIGLTGLAGGVLIPSFYAFPTVGSYFVLVAFVVVVLGGLGSLVGTVVGGLILGVVETGVGYLVPDLKDATHFVLLILLLAFLPNGLFGVKGAEKEALK